MNARLTLLFIASLTAGCVSVPRDAGFTDVRSNVAKQIDQQVLWNRGSAEDQQLAKATDKLLATPISIDAATQIALLNNHHLQATYEDLGIAQADLVQAGLLKNPVFFLQVRFPDSGPKGTNIEASVTQDFLSIFFIPAKKKVAAAQFEATKLKVADNVLDLATKVRLAYRQLQADEQLLPSWENARQTAEDTAELARRIHKAGNMNDLDFATRLAAAEQIKLEAEDFEQGVRVDREKLAQLMGIRSDGKWSIASNLPELPKTNPALTDLESLAQNNRLDLAAAKESVLAAEQQVHLTASSRFVPDSQLGIDSERNPDGSTVTGPNVTTQIPIFDNGQAAVARSVAQLRQARQQYEAAKVDAISEVHQAYQHLLAARHRATYHRDILLPLRRQIVQQSQLYHNGMLISDFDLLQARQDELSAERESVNALRDYWSAHDELQRAVGGRLEKTR